MKRQWNLVWCCAFSLLASSSKCMLKTMTISAVMTTSMGLFSCCSWHRRWTASQRLRPGSPCSELAENTKRRIFLQTLSNYKHIDFLITQTAFVYLW